MLHVITPNEVPIARDRIFKRKDQRRITRDENLIESNGAAIRGDENPLRVEEILFRVR